MALPLLVAASNKSPPDGPEIVGIGVDYMDKIREFPGIYKISYPLLVAHATALGLIRRLGGNKARSIY
jgi:hypothetical protein